MHVVIGLYIHNNDNIFKLDIYPTFSNYITMKRSLKANVKANVKVYLIPNDQLKFENNKPVLDDKYLVYDSSKKKR